MSIRSLSVTLLLLAAAAPALAQAPLPKTRPEQSPSMLLFPVDEVAPAGRGVP